MENRARVRLQFRAKVEIKYNSGTLIEGEARDVSMCGLFVVSEEVVPLNQRCDVELILEGKSSQLTITAAATVSRHETSGFGVQFVDDLEWIPVFSMFSKYGR